MKRLGKSSVTFQALLLLLLCLTSACAWFGKHGTYLILNVKADSAHLDQTVAQTMTVMKKRCDLLGIHCEVERFGGDHGSRIKIKILGSVNPIDPEHTKKILLSQGEDLEMRAVVSPPSPSPVQTYPTEKEAAAAAGADLDVLPYTETADDKQGTINRFVVVERTPIITGADIREAEAAPGYVRDKYQINFMLTPAGAGRFGQWTGANIDRYLAVVLNKQVRSVAYIKGQINDMGQINGKFTKQQAEDIAMLLMSGSLPVPIEAIEEGTD